MKIAIDQDQIKRVCKNQDIIYLGLFGSQVKGEGEKDSDVDLLVDFNETKSYFQLARLQEELENIFNKKVDLVLRHNIKEALRESILKDLKTIYEER